MLLPHPEAAIPRRHPEFAILGAALTLSATLVVAESLVRALRPTPRSQVVRDDTEGLSLGTMHGTVVWQTAEPVVDRRACQQHPDRYRIVAVGGSITRGSGVEGPDVWTEVLAGRLGDAACVENRAQPGATGEQKRAFALQALAEEPPPDLLFWEVWTNDRGRFLRLGDVAYDTEPYPTDSSGRPNPWSLPDTLNARLFGGSALYTYAVLASASDAHRDIASLWPALLEDTLVPVLDAADATGTEVVVLYAPALDRPFATWRADRYPAYAAVDALVAERSLDAVRIAEVFGDADPSAMGVDACCHYSVEGHRRVAEALEPRVRARLTARDAPLPR
jgi:lysophospholipase L1-like esterase